VVELCRVTALAEEELSRGNVVPISGTSSVERLAENVGAVDVRLTRAELDASRHVALNCLSRSM